MREPTRTEALVLDVLNRFVVADLETIDSAVYATLEHLATFADADTANLIVVDEDAQIFSVTHDLAEVIEDTLSVIRRLLPETICIEHVRGPGPIIIDADRAQLEQVIVNLAVNARDAMPQGGTLTFETRSVLVGERRISSGGAAQGSSVQLTVADTGEGIPAEILGHIFEPFFTTKPDGSGTGLGLATVYGIVGNHGATITVESEAGRGTTFRLCFPASQKTAPAARAATADVAIGGRETILLAEDQALVRNTTSGLLQDAGYRVVEANSGASAVELFLANPQRFDLLLLDIVMPELGGLEVSERAREVRPDIPILLTSGYARALLTSKVAGDVITKPYSRADLLQAVRKLLDASADQG